VPPDVLDDWFESAGRQGEGYVDLPTMQRLLREYRLDVNAADGNSACTALLCTAAAAMW
jgi:hypothetical protein